jgi:hypothetical protein
MNRQRMTLKNLWNPAGKHGPAVRAAHYTQRFAVLQIEITVQLDRTRNARRCGVLIMDASHHSVRDLQPMTDLDQKLLGIPHIGH